MLHRDGQENADRRWSFQAIRIKCDRVGARRPRSSSKAVNLKSLPCEVLDGAAASWASNPLTAATLRADSRRRRDAPRAIKADDLEDHRHIQPIARQRQHDILTIPHEGVRADVRRAIGNGRLRLHD